MKRRIIGLCSTAAFLAGACGFQARSPEDYRKDTRALLETRTAEVRACYDDVLRNDPNAGGSVAVRFVVVRRTGVVSGTEILPVSTAPAPLRECVRMALYGTTLQPPDEREGDATFVWIFNRS